MRHQPRAALATSRRGKPLISLQRSPELTVSNGSVQALLAASSDSSEPPRCVENLRRCNPIMAGPPLRAT